MIGEQLARALERKALQQGIRFLARRCSAPVAQRTSKLRLVDEKLTFVVKPSREQRPSLNSDLCETSTTASASDGDARFVKRRASVKASISLRASEGSVDNGARGRAKAPSSRTCTRPGMNACLRSSSSRWLGRSVVRTSSARRRTAFSIGLRPAAASPSFCNQR